MRSASHEILHHAFSAVIGKYYDSRVMVRFNDGTYYCDDGQEVNRRMFWWFHTDNTICKHGERSESV